MNETWLAVLLWLLLFAIMVAFETFMPTLFLIWFAVGALFGCITALLGFGPIIQIIVFTITSVITLLLARPFVKKFIEKDKIAPPTNAYSLLDSKAIVLREVNQMNGKVKIMNTGETWTAYTYEAFDPIKEAAQVIVKEIDGAKLIVIPKDTETEKDI